MECGNLDLNTWLRNRKTVNPLERKFYWKNMLEAVQTIHKHGPPPVLTQSFFLYYILKAEILHMFLMQVLSTVTWSQQTLSSWTLHWS